MRFCRPTHPRSSITPSNIAQDITPAPSPSLTEPQNRTPHTKRFTLQNSVHADLLLLTKEQPHSKLQRRDRHSALRQTRARLLHEMLQLFPTVSAAHQRQNGLFALIDGLLRKAELQRYLREKSALEEDIQEEDMRQQQRDSQKLLQMINRLLRENSRISRRVRVNQQGGQSAPEFTAAMLGTAENVLRYPVAHHHSVKHSALDLMNAFRGLKTLLSEFFEKSNGSLDPELVEGDHELTHAYLYFCTLWKRFTYLFFKERAYHLVQVDVA